MPPRESERTRVVATPDRQPETTPPLYPSANYDFMLQAIMEMQRSLGKLDQAVTMLSEQNKIQADKLEKFGEKLNKISHKIYAATIIVVIFASLGSIFLRELFTVIASHIFVK